MAWLCIQLFIPQIQEPSLPAPHLPTQPIICPYQFHLLFHQISLKSTQSPLFSEYFQLLVPHIHSSNTLSTKSEFIQIQIGLFLFPAWKSHSLAPHSWLSSPRYGLLGFGWPVRPTSQTPSHSILLFPLSLSILQPDWLSLLLKTSTLRHPTRFWYKLFPFSGRLIPLPRTWSSQYLTHLLFICSSIISSVLITFFQSLYVSL